MPRTRRRQWGSITEVKRGRKYVLRWTQNTPAGRKRLTKTFYGTRAQANLELERIHIDRAGDRPVPTVARAWEAWTLPTMQRRVEEGTLSAGSMKIYASAWNAHVRDRWGNTPVDALRAVDLQEWLLTLSASQAAAALNLLRKVYSSVSVFVVLPLNPFAPTVTYTMPRRRERERSKGVYTLDEAREVARALHGHPLEGAFYMSCFASCRMGESLAVKLGDIEVFESGESTIATADIVRQMPRKGFEPLPDGQLKTDKSNRTTIVFPEYASRLIEIMDERRAFGTEWLTDRGDGLPMGTDRCRHSWESFCKSNDVRWIPWQNLRNSWRTIAEMEYRLPWDLTEILMGHKLPGMSGAHYIRPSKEQLVCIYCKALGTI